MAIDQKFITSGISKDTVASINRRRKRSRRDAPRPWDPPISPPISEVQNFSEQLDDTSRSLEDPTLDVVSTPTHSMGEFSLEDSKRAEKIQEQNTDTMFRNKIPEQTNEVIAPSNNTETKYRNNVPEQNTGTNELETLDSVNTGTKHRNKVPEQSLSIGTKSLITINNNEDSSSSQDSEYRNKVPEQSTGTNYVKFQHESVDQSKFRNKIPEHYDHQNSSKKSDYMHPSEKVGEQGTGTEYRNKVPEQTMSTATNSTKYRNKYRYYSGTKNRNTNEVKVAFEDTNTVRLTANFSREENPFCALRGLKKDIIFFVFEQLAKNNVSSILASYKILADALGANKESVATTCKRIRSEAKPFFKMNLVGKGPGSELMFYVEEEMMKYFVSFRVGAPQGTGTIAEQSTGTNTGIFPSSSSSKNFNNITTTTEHPDQIELLDEWAEIITPVNLKELGFGLTQIKQLFRKGLLAAEDVQDSLDNFAYDLEVGQVRAKGPKLAMLMGILRKGDVYNSEARTQEFRAEAERNKRLKVEIEQVKKDSAAAALVEKARERMSKMSDDEKRALLPQTGNLNLSSQVLESLVLGRITEQMEGEKS